MIRKFFGVVAACMLFVASQASAEDLLGWQNTRWGMTEQQAATALGQDAQRINPPHKFKRLYVPLKSTISISHFNIDVDLQFSNETKTLAQVLLTYDGAGHEELWAKLRDLLTEKYGAPHQVGTTKREWRFKTTIIVLDLLDLPLARVQSVSVSYYPASDYKDEKSKL
jgi:hypothetical protein